MKERASYSTILMAASGKESHVQKGVNERVKD